MRTLTLFLGLYLLLTVVCYAATSYRSVHRQVPPGLRDDDQPRVPHAPARSDTVWFGGMGADGLALEGGIWDFDSPPLGDGGMQGWTSRDRTADIGVRFGAFLGQRQGITRI